MLFDNLMDITKHTHGLGFINMAKLVCDEENGSSRLEAIEDDSTVVMYGEFHNPIPDLTGTVGLGRMGILSGYLNFKPFSEDGSSVKLVKESRGGREVPTEILFDSKQGHTANYRFMSEEFANEQIKVPPFTGAEFSVDIAPHGKPIRELNAMFGILGNFESNFTARTKNGKLEFLIGSGGADRTTITFANNVSGELSHAWSYPLHHVLTILKLQNSSNSLRMYFSDRGAMKFEVDSGIAKYTYILPARKD